MKAGVELYLGAWLGKYKTENKREVESIVQIARQNFKQVKGLIIGNEVLLRKDMTENELIGHIREVKSSTTVPVTSAEIWSVWLTHPELADEVDFLMVHIHPYWEGVAVEEAAEHVMKTWTEMKAAFPGIGPSSTGTLKLTAEWKKYTIDLTGEDTSNVIGGFCWVTNTWQNPKGCTIYLDDIVFE